MRISPVPFVFKSSSFLCFVGVASVVSSFVAPFCLVGVTGSCLALAPKKALESACQHPINCNKEEHTQSLPACSLQE
jgi:hypothetical protein